MNSITSQHPLQAMQQLGTGFWRATMSAASVDRVERQLEIGRKNRARRDAIQQARARAQGGSESTRPLTFATAPTAPAPAASKPKARPAATKAATPANQNTLTAAEKDLFERASRRSFV